jgi:HEAT repeat protein
LRADLVRGEGYLGVEVSEGAAGSAEGSAITILRSLGGTPAASGGLRSDDVIEAVDSVPVAGTAKLVEYVRGKRAGQRLALSVTRQGKPLHVEVELAARPDVTAGQGGADGKPGGPLHAGKSHADVNAAVERLAAGGAATLPVLRGWIADAELEVRDRMVALKAAGKIDRNAAVEAAADVAGGEGDPTARALALFQLAEWDRQKASRQAVELLGDRSLDLRLAAAGVVRATGDTAAVPRLRALLEDPTPLVRATAASVLGWLGDPQETAALLEQRLRDPSPLVRLAALEQLTGSAAAGYSRYVLRNADLWAVLNGPRLVPGPSGDPAAKHPMAALPAALEPGRLLALLADPSDGVAAMATAALHRHLDRYQNQNAAVPAAFLDALGRLDRQSASPVRQTQYLALAHHLQRSVAQGFVTNGEEAERATEKILLPATRDPDPVVARSAVEALGFHGSADAAGRLQELVLDPASAPELRKTAIRTLGAAAASEETAEARERLLRSMVADLSPQRDFDLWAEATLSLARNYRTAPYYEDSLIRALIDVLEHPRADPETVKAALELLSDSSSKLARRAVERHRKTRGVLV